MMTSNDPLLLYGLIVDKLQLEIFYEFHLQLAAHLMWSLGGHSLQCLLVHIVYVQPLLLSIALDLTQSCTEPIASIVLCMYIQLIERMLLYVHIRSIASAILDTVQECVYSNFMSSSICCMALKLYLDITIVALDLVASFPATPPRHRSLGMSMSNRPTSSVRWFWSPRQS